ncbi:ATP:cob(I)alamin adenosyltransferase [Candidatus Roizmanbacteria bacterium RIFCSPHIGHO2_01_FULL_39_12b]|uniref:Corrinoid adenosyltransferase n=1 Tax=Candidatus Roizmanbacteria bacterium RIFCSPHIGHO2_01_FULL_39_12b TaxID=1802030 RepID=A0A1F7G8H2_9BACT|nr:MAG: ATP:cob(I)alamin adenosyltransferase [Candidatus Roizmanbacteria bacterium RIFCSPHIGHO2_01_FULL_39_12b]OGK46014.1 MAG: ATP:cob(I)alamin adenosyltransferase [Candidatus Roizmanbacteria bacterium RIFCSPLOWO2_01_FULL_39_19]
MPVYTRTGDDGTTSLFGGKRLLKNNAQVKAYGAVDEVTSFLGLVLLQNIDSKDRLLLTSIQKNLYNVMGFLSGAGNKLIRDLSKATVYLEEEIDRKEKVLPKLNRFILPQGTPLCVFCHIARTTTRRCERQLVEFFKLNVLEKNSVLNVIAYINRLSDYLFVLSRWYNREQGDMLT